MAFHDQFWSRAGVTVAATLGLLSACQPSGDPASPYSDDSSPLLSVVPANPGPNIGSPDIEFFEVCKVFSGPGASSATATFTYTVDIGTTGFVDHNGSFSLADGECEDIWLAGGTGASNQDLVTVTETGPPGVTVEHQANYVDNPGNTWSGSLTSGTVVGDWVNAEQGVTVYFYNQFPTGGGEGCTPGYWRQPHHFDSWVGYAPGDPFSGVFDLPAKLVRPEHEVDPATLDLLDAVTLRGGKVNALTRHAVAAILNAASPDVDYDLTELEVINLYNNAIASGKWKGPLGTLVGFNEQTCPLN